MNTVSFVKLIEPLPDQGYIICPSVKSVIPIGIQTFTCLAGSKILQKYICDGIIDCPDRSDELYCVCDGIRQLKICKTVKKSKHLKNMFFKPLYDQKWPVYQIHEFK